MQILRMVSFQSFSDKDILPELSAQKNSKSSMEMNVFVLCPTPSLLTPAEDYLAAFRH